MSVIGRREFLITGGLTAAGIALSRGLEGFLGQPEDNLFGKSRENGEVLGLKLSPFVNLQGEEVQPIIRKEPKINARQLEPDELEKLGINPKGTLRGIKVWGGTYASPDERGEGPYGKWAALFGKDGRLMGYVSENFVTYQKP